MVRRFLDEEVMRDFDVENKAARCLVSFQLGLEILKRPLVERVDWDLRARYDHFTHLSHLWLLRIHIQ